MIQLINVKRLNRRYKIAIYFLKIISFFVDKDYIISKRFEERICDFVCKNAIKN